MTAPPLTEDRRKIINDSVDILLNSKMWSEGYYKGYTNKMKMLLASTSALVLVCVCTSLIMFSLTSFTEKYLGVFMSVIAVGIASAIVFLVVMFTALRNTRKSNDEPFLFYDGTNLWLLMPQKDMVEHEMDKMWWNIKTLDRYDLIAVRELLQGPAKKMSSVQIEDMLHIAKIVDNYKIGNSHPAWTMDIIEEISLVDSNEKEKTTKIMYTDAISLENRTLTLDTYGWREFLEWLEEQLEEQNKE